MKAGEKVIGFLPVFLREYDELLKKLGKYKTGVSCLYVNKLEDVDMKVLKELITKSVQKMKSKK
jgi:hypothetical protein